MFRNGQHLLNVCREIFMILKNPQKYHVFPSHEVRAVGFPPSLTARFYQEKPWLKPWSWTKIFLQHYTNMRKPGVTWAFFKIPVLFHCKCLVYRDSPLLEYRSPCTWLLYPPSAPASPRLFQGHQRWPAPRWRSNCGELTIYKSYHHIHYIYIYILYIYIYLIKYIV